MWGNNREETAEFDLVWRGYHREQVDRCFEQLEAKLVEALTERELLAELPEQLAATREELEAAYREIDRLRMSGAEGTTVMLNSRIQEILGAAEEEAVQLRRTAAAELAAARQEADELLWEAHEQALQARRDFETALQARREKERHSDEVLRAAAEAEAQDILATAKAEAERIRQEARQQRVSGIKPAPSFMRWVTRHRKAQARAQRL